ncbi:MAG: magnesium transporter MgtE N-terminal domain-containing protein [Candidatus Dormibacteraceae bacterium]
MRVYFSQVVGRPVLARAGDRVGNVADGVLKLIDGSLPRLTGILLRVEGTHVFVSVSDLDRLTDQAFQLRTAHLDTRGFERRPGEVMLMGDMRSRSVIDVEGARLVRVKDVVLEGEGSNWQVQAVVSAPPQTLTGVIWRALGRQARGGEEIPWARIEPLVGHVPTLGRGLPFARLAQLHPADIADIVEAASHDEGEQIMNAVQGDRELEADVFEELSEDKQLEFLNSRPDQEAATVLSNMNPDDAADLLTKLDQPRRKPILELLAGDQQAKVRALLGYGEETAGGLMSNEFVALDESATVAEALRYVRQLPDESHVLTVIYTLQGEALAGAVTLPRLLRCPTRARLKDVAENSPVAVYPDADIPSVAVEMADYNLSALPVVDEQRRIVGVITYDDLIEAMLPDEWRWRGRAARANESGGS